jgi:hypothetical protein
MKKTMAKYYLAGVIGLAICVALIVFQQIAKKTPVLVINEELLRSYAVASPTKSNLLTHDEETKMAKIMCDDWMHELEIAIASQPHSFKIVTKEEREALPRLTWRLVFQFRVPTADAEIDTYTVSWDLWGPGGAHFTGLDNTGEIARRVTAIINNFHG